MTAVDSYVESCLWCAGPRCPQVARTPTAWPGPKPALGGILNPSSLHLIRGEGDMLETAVEALLDHRKRSDSGEPANKNLTETEIESLQS